MSNDSIWSTIVIKAEFEYFDIITIISLVGVWLDGLKFHH